jgi:hypothetical protein
MYREEETYSFYHRLDKRRISNLKYIKILQLYQHGNDVRIILN